MADDTAEASEPSEAQQAALAELGYSEEWLRSGILDPDLLAEQHERLAAGGTRKTGKYRAAALKAWLAAADSIEDEQIDAFVALVAGDPDSKACHPALAELIGSPRISLSQLERIARADPGVAKRHEGLIRRTYLTRRLEDGVDDEVLAQVIESRDPSVQTRLVRDARLTRKQAELLAKQGANTTIRQNAQAWVQDKKAWR